MADIASIWNLQRLGFARGDEVERMTPDILVRDRLRDLRHMAGDAFVASATGLMMRVRLDRGGVWPCLCVGAVTVEA